MIKKQFVNFIGIIEDFYIFEILKEDLLCLSRGEIRRRGQG